MSAFRARPYVVVSDGKGNLFEDTGLFLAGRSGFNYEPLYIDQMIEVPEGSDFFELKGRLALGYAGRGRLQPSQQGIATACFAAPAYTALHLAAWIKNGNVPVLPLYAYSPLGWHEGKFYTSAMRIDPDERQDCRHFNQDLVVENGRRMKEKFPGNRLVEHVVDNCACTYLCPAARNFCMNRWEAPLPVSPSCNSQCLGCISLQPEGSSPIPCTQPRILFTPKPEEIEEMAVFHLETAERAVVSFGQGCEGEPLLAADTIGEAIRLIRKKTKKGIINLNTNGSRPDALKELCKAGLDSVRISMNSAREQWYNAYYRPKGYGFSDVLRSMETAREYNCWVSLNYFVLPGFTDQPEEQNALAELIRKYKTDMIQWRNFNIDPDWLFEEMQVPGMEETKGMKNYLKEVRTEFPDLAFGYFNPPAEVMTLYRK